VIFEDVKTETHAESATGISETAEREVHPRIRQLEQELTSTKEYLQTTIEELETSNEELKSTNEELQSSNEELQSTNEELETSKEELQSVNEELTTVNSELQQKIDDLSKAGSDMNNLLTSTEIGTIFLDTNLHIQRFTPAVTNFLNLIQSDIGRPVSHIVPNMDYEHLVEDAAEVLSSLVSKELEVRTKHDRWYSMRILPYRTIENVIDGVVVTFMEITELKALEHALRESEERHRNLFNDAQVALFQWRISDGKITECNDLFASVMGYGDREECLAGNSFADHYVNAKDRAKMLAEIEEHGEVKEYEARINRTDGSACRMIFSARLYREKGYIEGAAVDVAEREKTIVAAKKDIKRS
jgi:two-component system, chemotaxis family, CheB/CheR fusion protein